MRRFSISCCALNLSISVVMCGFVCAEEAAVSELDAQSKQAVQRIWSLLEAVLDNHVAPPTRQQMIHAGLRDLWKHTHKGEEFDRQFARRISDLNERSEIEDFLATQFSSASQASSLPIGELEVTFIHASLRAAPGAPNYLPAKEAAVQQQILANRYVGIGIAIGMDTDDEYSSMNVVFPRGPAHRQGARKGDLMLSIDGFDTKGLKLHEIVARLRGAAGTPVSLVVRQPDSQETRALTMVRGEVPIETVLGRERRSDEDWNYAVAGSKDIAYVNLSAIRASTVGELRETARKLTSQNFRAVILELREAQGGELRHAAMVADLLLENVPIGSAVIRGRREDFTSNAESLFPGWPMAVIINGGTTGQAEWIAASLQQRRKTVFIGSNTSGLGYVTEPIQLAGGAAIHLRTGFFQRPDGKSLVSDNAEDPAWFMREMASQVRRIQSSRANFVPPQNSNGIAPDLVIVGDPIEFAAAILGVQLMKESDIPNK